METFLILVLFVFINGIAGSDYCDKTLCPSGTHIACGHNGDFSSKCPKDAALINFSTPLISTIVNGFNAKRNFIAGGGHHNHKPACRMATMQWDRELANLAELNVRQCEMKKDACHNTKAYSNSGQNLAWMTYQKIKKPNYEKLIENSLQMWYDEVNQCKMEFIKKYPQQHTGAVIEHFTAMVGDRNNRVGCAASTYSVSNEDYNVFLMACNFAYTNVIGQPVYQDCPKSTLECNTGRNSKYPHLCSESEEFSVK
ncbi:antigen 5 like allergen Cul n 1-like [Musca vetustissima]|uniref:antigen 5 like allergen Cul n 1-like n=1 Tax=Musca vetustissima TaxID=27455 RepID=UPI002AB62C96|nr:antigen 5 like allergen Cul n 1-like [Musca vetustissima]